MNEIIVRNKRSGRHFFEEDTMRFFNTQVESSHAINGYFITSETFDDYNLESFPRLYTIRREEADGRITTIGEFQGYETVGEASFALLDLVRTK